MFDPYRKWLGIPPKDQPANHYRLFGLELFESDLDVIEGAVDRQMGFVRQYQSGEHAADAARILNDLAKARLCLLKRATKSAYDAELRQQLSPAETASEFPEDPLSFADDLPSAAGWHGRCGRKPISTQCYNTGFRCSADACRNTFVTVVTNEVRR